MRALRDARRDFARSVRGRPLDDRADERPLADDRRDCECAHQRFDRAAPVGDASDVSDVGDVGDVRERGHT